MTRQELYEHVIACNCIVEPFESINITGNAVRFRNPRTNGRAFMNTPIDDQELTEKAVQTVVTQLGIPFP